MIIIRKKPGHQGQKYAIVVPGGLQLDFRHGYLGDELVFAAHLPDDHPRARALRGRLGRNRAFILVTKRDDEMSWGTDAPTPAPTLTTDPQFSEPEQIALSMGWTVLDLLGAGIEGQLGREGGTSPRSGLTLGQMHLCSPPNDWNTHAPTRYPWELADWTPPGIGFAPPNMPSKRSGEEDTLTADEEQRVEAALALTTDDEAPPILVNPDGSATQGGVEISPAASSEEGAPPAEGEAPEAASDSEPGDVPPELSRHLAVAVDLFAQAGEKPAISKLRYWLKKDDLKITTQEYELLMTAL